MKNNYARAVQQNPSGMIGESEKSYKPDIRVKELKSLESVGADRGFIPPSVRYRNILNFGTGLILGCISVPMWNYSKFLYYSVFCVQAVILYILINYSSTSLNKDLTENQK